MQFQFSTRFLLLITAIVAITCAGVIAWTRVFVASSPFLGVALYVGVTFPLWVPVVFLTFVIGHRAVTIRLVLAFAVAETAAVGICYLVSQMHW